MLNGEKVTLRALEEEDLPALAAWANDLEIEVLGGGDPPTPKSVARVRVEHERRQAESPADVSFAIEADGKLIGMISLFRVDTTARTSELGIVIGERAYWGKGYGRDAIRTVVDYAFRHRNFQRVWLTVTENNGRAVNAYKRCGFIEEGRLRHHVWSDGEHRDLVCMGVLREEWSRP
ncbi:MAG: GNAT family N-acetyltransferase, partial [Actinomycetota bacterium]|nr:GNAT family N-acetyltransferase [Actinomycetota bacterium]